MSEKDKKKKFREITRRDFLKDASIIVGGAAIGSTALLAACGGEEVTKTATTTRTATTTVTETVSRFVCPYDGIEFDTFDDLAAHIETVHPGEVQTITKYTCPYDNQEFATLVALGAHLNVVHGGESPAPPGEAVPGLITLNVNGESYLVHVKPEWSLAFVLREKLGLPGTKIGCDRGSCGTCTVIIDGRPVYSCMMLAIEASGKDILTIEGLSDGITLSPVQQAFFDKGASQCGFCTPGFIMSATALFDKNPNPTRDEVREALSGHICICGEVKNFIDALLSV